MKSSRWRILLALLFSARAISADPPATDELPSADDIFEAGTQLFNELAPDEIKQEVDLPTKKQWDEFVRRLQSALDHNRLEDLAAYETEARAVLVAWRALPGYENYVSWLEERMDYIEAAKQTVGSPAPAGARVPYYPLWVQRVQARPAPARAGELLPQLREIFLAAGIPPELAWLAEVESSFNADARSPAGARGLYQLMPATARELGLSAARPDERADPGKNAQAAAKYLKQLRQKFGDWPLALAAYNAGPGKISRSLAAKGGKTFADIASDLSAETRMYVPKVLATVAVRTGVTPEKMDADD